MSRKIHHHLIGARIAHITSNRIQLGNGASKEGIRNSRISQFVVGYECINVSCSCNQIVCISICGGSDTGFQSNPIAKQIEPGVIPRDDEMNRIGGSSRAGNHGCNDRLRRNGERIRRTRIKYRVIGCDHERIGGIRYQSRIDVRIRRIFAHNLGIVLENIHITECTGIGLLDPGRSGSSARQGRYILLHNGHTCGKYLRKTVGR